PAAVAAVAARRRRVGAVPDQRTTQQRLDRVVGGGPQGLCSGRLGGEIRIRVGHQRGHEFIVELRRLGADRLIFEAERAEQRSNARGDLVGARGKQLGGRSRRRGVGRSNRRLQAC